MTQYQGSRNPLAKSLAKKFFLTFDFKSKRWYDENGFLHVDECNLTKEQVVGYYGFEIPGWEELDLDPDKEYMGYRPADELEKAVKLFNGIPLTLRHYIVTADEPDAEHEVGNIGTSATWVKPYIKNALTITKRKGIDAVESEECREISCGYQFVPDFTPGTFEGKHYDFVMRDIRPNHTAIVEEGRTGPDVFVADEKPIKPLIKGNTMSIKKRKFKGAQDDNPQTENAELEKAASIAQQAQEIIGLHTVDPVTGEVQDITGDEDTEDAIKKIITKFASNLSPEDAQSFATELVGMFTPKSAGDESPDENGQTATDEDNEKKPTSTSSSQTQDEDIDKEQAITKAMDACNLDSDDDAVREAFAKGFEAGAKDTDPDEPLKTGKDEESPSPIQTKQAQDRAMKRVAMDTAARVKQHMRSLYTAARVVEPVTGEIDAMAFDTAADIYRYGLKKVGKVVRTNDVNALKEMFVTVMDAKSMAYDAATIDDDVEYDGIFAGLGRIKN